MATDPEDGSWVWTRHRQGPALCKEGLSGAQDHHAISTQRLFAAGQAPAQTVHSSDNAQIGECYKWSEGQERLGKWRQVLESRQGRPCGACVEARGSPARQQHWAIT